MKQQPKVSVIVPIYGVEKYLRQCLDSIVTQTLQDLEILLIDDGSKDGCAAIIDEYAAKDARIVAVHKPNGGYGQSMNVGLDTASGEYIGIVEPDDFIDHEMYERLYDIASQSAADIVKSSFINNLQCPQEKRCWKEMWSDMIPENHGFTLKEYPQFLFYHPSVWSAIYKTDFLCRNHIRFVEAPGAGWTDNPFQVQTMCLAQKIIYTSAAYYHWLRVNYYESDDLKDYRLPFLRSDEIHQWLDAQKITDEGILAALYKRELAYIRIVLGMRKIADEEDCYRRIQAMCLRMNKDIMEHSAAIKRKEKKVYRRCLRAPQSVRLAIMLKRYKEQIFSFCFNRKRVQLKIFGKVLLRREFNA